MKGRSLTPYHGRWSSGPALASALLFAQHAVAQQQRDPGNPTSPSVLNFSPTLKIALIAGGGGGLLLVVVLIIVICCVRRRKKKKRLPEAQTPVATGFNPDALPANPAPPESEATTATFDARPPYRSPSDRLPQNPTPFNDYNRGGTPIPPEPSYGGDGWERASPAPSNSMASRRGADVSAKLRVGATPHPPSGVGIDGYQQPARAGGWAAVEQAKAWGMHGRHIDQQGQYYGSIAQQGGQGPPSRGVRPPGAGPPPVRQNAPPPAQPAAVYGDDDIYSQRAYAAEHEDDYSAHEMVDNPAGNRYGGGNPYRPQPAPTPARYSPPNNGNPYANPYATNQDRYAPSRNQNRGYGGGGGGAGGYGARGYAQQDAGGGYGDYGAGQYGHTREDSAESDRSYYNYGAQPPANPNRWV
jgi:hypothetical protein